MSHLLYLYGFVRAGRPPPPGDLLGVGDAGVRLVELGEVAAAVSSVPSAAFDPAVVGERVHDLAWIGEQGALHERVVTWFVDHGGILPARLLTLYSGEDALREAMRGVSSEVAERLARFEGLREWDLKVSYEGEVLADHLGEFSEEVAGLEREMEDAAPGRRYLLERKRERLVGSEVARAARRLAEDLLERLATLAREVRRLPLPREHGDLPVILNAALLIPGEAERGAAGLTGQERERLRPLGVEVLFTGPWAPYRFLGEEPDGSGYGIGESADGGE